MGRTSKRNSNIDLLRIISMIFIICHHLIYNGINWGGLINSGSMLSYPPLFYQLGGVLEVFFIVGVDIFYILSGYFRIEFSWEKIFKTIITLYLYVILINSLGIIDGTFNINSAIKNMLLAIHNYWFLEVYMVLMLISPFLNCILNHMDTGRERHFFLVFTVIFCGYTFIANSTYLGVARGYSLVFACCLYILGGLLQKMKHPKEINVGALIYIISVVLATFIMLLCINNNYCKFILNYVLAYNNPLVVLESIGLVLIFKNVKFKNTKLSFFISNIAISTMAVYILHSTNAVLTKYRNMPMHFFVSEDKWLYTYLLLIPYGLLIFMICVLIDKAFKKIFGKMIANLSTILSKIITIILQKI